MKLFIKNMVCPRCILVVRDILRQAGIEASSGVLGEAVLPAELTAERRKELDEALRAVGFELIDDRRKQTVERVKNTVIELVREKDAALRTNLSDYIADRLHQDYGAVSSLFSEIENTTIEQYFFVLFFVLVLFLLFPLDYYRTLTEHYSFLLQLRLHLLLHNM